MADTLALILAALCCVIGFGWLALAMDVHWQQALGATTRSSSMPTRLRVLGAAALGTSLILCLTADHPSIASLVWLMTLAAGAQLIAFTLSWRARVLSMLVPWVRASSTTSIERGEPSQ